MKAFLSLILCFGLSGTLQADWPQWRGPDRNGKAIGGDLPDAWSEENPPQLLWESEIEIPSDHYGGHGSVSIADGKVYMSLIWHRDEPTETRRIDGSVLSDLGYRGGNLSDEQRTSMEEARMGMSPRLRGSALDDWAKEWVEANLDEKQKLSLGGWVISRFKKGATAIPLADYEIMRKANSEEFANQEEMEAWVHAQEWNDPTTAEKVIAAVPNTEKVANDVILCLSLEDGSTLWKFEVPGHPAGRSASSTPAVADGTVYGVFSEYVYAVDAETGEEKWRFETGTKRGLASSPLVDSGKVFVQTGKLVAIDAKTGELVWEQPEVRATNSSPAVWNDVIICNSSKELLGMDIETGEVKWRQVAGGDGTPSISGDTMVVTSRTDGQSFTGYRLSIEGAQEMWANGFLARRYGASPIIHDGYAYHLGSARHMCVNVETGEVMWEVERQSNISSPIFVDGKLLVYENNGGFLAMIPADPTEHQITGRVKVGALSCPTPAVSGDLAVMRLKDKLVCYDLAPEA